MKDNSPTTPTPIHDHSTYSKKAFDKIQHLDLGKDPDAGKDLRKKEKGMTEDEMVG